MDIEAEKQAFCDWVEACVPALAGKVLLVSDRDASVSPGGVLELPYLLVTVSTPASAVGGASLRSIDGTKTFEYPARSVFRCQAFGQDGETYIATLIAMTQDSRNHGLALTCTGDTSNLTGLDQNSMEGRYAQDFLVQSRVKTTTQTGGPPLESVENEYNKPTTYTVTIDLT